MRFILLTCFFLINALAASGQWAIDKALQQIPRPDEASIETLCNYISKNASGDLEKARGAYYWIAHNIHYQVRKFIQGRPTYTDPEKVFKHRKAVCAGYSNLYQEMCKRLHLQCIVVVGYDKGYGYSLGKALYESTHAWNAVKVGSDWHLVDVTWASGGIRDRLIKRFVPKGIHRFQDKYFDVPPKEMILTHLPEIPVWQFIEHPVTVKEFTGDEAKLYSHLKNIPSEKYDYRTPVQAFLADTVDKEVKYGLAAVHFNPLNVLPLAEAREHQIYKWMELDSGGKVPPGYHLNSLRPNLLDSVIEKGTELQGLLKIANSHRKGVLKMIRLNREWTNDVLSALYLTRSQNEANGITGKNKQSFDSLSYSAKPVLESLNKAIQANEGSRNRRMRKLLTAELCSKYGDYYEKYTRFAEEEPSPGKKKLIRKECDQLLQDAKKNIPKPCSWYPDPHK